MEVSTPTSANPGHLHNSVSQARSLCPQPARPHTSWVASLLHHHDICQLLGPLDPTTTSPHSAITSCALPDASPCTRYMGKWDPLPVALRWRICHWARAAGSGTCWPCIASWLLLHTLGTADQCTPDQSGPMTLLLSLPQKDLPRESCVIPGGSEAVVPPATLKRVYTGQGTSLCKFSALTTYDLGLFWWIPVTPQPAPHQAQALVEHFSLIQPQHPSATHRCLLPWTGVHSSIKGDSVHADGPRSLE